MKIQRLQIQNIGILTDVDIEINKPLIVFFGDIRQGKTTILKAIKLLFGGTFSDDIIKHGEDEAYVKLTFDNGAIRREFYRTKQNTIASRPITFVMDNEVVTKPVETLKKIINPFQLNQNHFIDMSYKDKAAFLIELFGVDTRTIDEEIDSLASQAQEIRKTIKLNGFADVPEIASKEPVDISMLEKKRQTMYEVYQKESQEINSHNQKASHIEWSISELDNEKTRLESELKKALDMVAKCEKALKQNAKQKSQIVPLEKKSIPVLNLSSIDDQIEEARKHNNLLKRVIDAETHNKAQEDRETELKKVTAEIKELRDSKLKQLKDSSLVEGLEFTEDGDFYYQDTKSDMLSDSMQMELSAKLSALYPKGLQLEMIDRGESLGSSIYDLIDNAIKNERTILVTKVGERDPQIPNDVGVYVVEGGVVK